MGFLGFQNKFLENAVYLKNLNMNNGDKFVGLETFATPNVLVVGTYGLKKCIFQEGRKLISHIANYSLIS